MLSWFRTRFDLNAYDMTKAQSSKPSNLQTRNYFAAQQNRLFDGWNTQAQSADCVVRNNLKSLRARSREQSYNNDYMARFLGLLESNVVGPNGFALSCQPLDDDGQTVDVLAGDAIEEAFRQWAHKSNADISKRFNFRAMSRLFVRTVAQDGEFIAVQHFGPRVNRFGYALELIDPECLDVEFNNNDMANGHYIRMGIEFDKNGAPVAYYFTTDGGENCNYGEKKYKRVESRLVIHAFLPTMIGQKRGIPWASTALARMKMLEGYENAAITAARAGASKMGFYTTPTGEEYTGNDEAANGALITDFEAGAFEQLPEGTTFTPFDPSYPSGEFSHFMKACLRGISSGLGINYNALANDLEGVNFSSIRAGVIEDREVWKGLQAFVIDEFLKPVYENWLISALTYSPPLVMGKPLKFGKLDKYMRAHFQGKRWDWVDPLKDISALEKEHQLGVVSLSQIMREKGRDPIQVWQEIQKERETMERLGIKPSQALNAAANQSPTQEQPAEPETTDE